MAATILQNIGLQNMTNVSSGQTQNTQQSAEGNSGFSNILDAAKNSTQTAGQSGSQNVKAQVQNKISQSAKSETGTDKTDKADKSVSKDQSPKTSQSNQTDRTDKTDKTEKIDQPGQENSDKVTDDTVADTGNVCDADAATDIKDAIAEAGNQLVKDIAKELNLSDEDVQNAMQILGFTVADLLNPQNLTQLVTTLTGETDSIGILTDGNLYQSLQDLLQTADELKNGITEAFQLSEEQLQTVIDSVSKQGENPEPAVFSDYTDNSAEQVTDDKTHEPQKLQQFNVLKTAQNGEITQVKITVDDQSGSRTEGDPEVVTLNEQLNQEPQGDTSENNLTEDTTGRNILDQIINSLGKANTTVSASAGTFQETMAQSTGQTSDMQSIVNQITEYLKVQMKPDMTSMELQLHPQSLGTVNVIVSAARDGSMVAQFTAQNETVKAAIESQVAQLQQRFDEQGIKVNAVEVTVQSHQFEQNLEQGAQQQENTGNTRTRSGRAIRRINLGEPVSQDNDMEQMDDASRITAQMMAANGNTVDYTA